MTEAQIEALVRLADVMVQEWIESGGDSDLFDTLEALALIEPIPGGFDPDKHEGPYTDFLEPGDDYYQMAPWLAAAIKRLRKAEGAVSEPTQP